ERAHGGVRWRTGGRATRCRSRLAGARAGAGRRRSHRGSGVIGVLLVDDAPLLRMGFRMVLEAQPDVAVVGEAGDGAEAVALATRLKPDVVLMDVRMPGVDGIEATARITAA